MTARRNRFAWFAATLCCTLALSFTRAASADPALRVQMDLHGDFVLFGNTVAQECATSAPAVPAPIVGTINTCPNSNPNAPDVYWRSDSPADGQATADNGIAPEDARSTAVLALPSGAEVKYARLYWGALSNASGPDMNVRVQRPSAALDTGVTASDSVRVNDAMTGRFWYQSSADVTALVKAQGPGAFRIAGIESVDIVGLNDTHPVIAWYMVVLYSHDGDPSRNLAIFDGLDLVDQMMNSASATLSGFLVPAAGFDAKLGVVAYEGEPQLNGDSLSFNGSTLSNAVNPANNFFNATRSQLGSALTVVGDLPQLTGTARSLSNVDFDVVDVKSLVMGGDTSATIAATTNQDTYLLAAFITSISTYKPDFVTSTKTVTDINGGAVRPGDELEYLVDIHNTGSDTSVSTVMHDALPAGVSFVPGSIEVVSGANMGTKTDASGDDQAEYTSGTRTVTVRIGDGASSSSGGQLDIGDSTSIRFHVKVDAGASGTIANQAVISAAGVQGATSEDTPTDGNGVEPGEPPTDVTVDLCEKDADCTSAKPFCDITSSPHTCVECLTSAQCTAKAQPDCNFTTHVCECAAGSCNKDSDNDGISDSAEKTLGTDPNDADTDDDGVPDGSELAPDQDSDADGLINALDPDSDNDGLFDGTELGLDCASPAIDLTRKVCRADADKGKTETSPIDRDTDGGGASDGSEDSNLDGAFDRGETDPTDGHAKDDKNVKDTDKDGLGDDLETTLHSDPNDADSDDDGALDGEEPNPSADNDGDGLIDVLDVDSDDDALFDGTELGKTCSRKGTDAKAGHCRPDNDGGATKTSAVVRDTDGGGKTDGSEDSNLNGIVDAGEADPTAGHAGDDKNVKDKDGDGLSDALENTLGSDPSDKDTDDDGARDGEEANPSDDGDGDKKVDVLDADSDGDSLFDGTELGKDCNDAATDNGKRHCSADADAGATRTSPVNPDTDFGGLADGAEDQNTNGQIDGSETDPNDPRDDKVGQACTSDADCGATDSGVVCVSQVCTLGCRGQGGNGCPDGRQCSSATNAIGACMQPGALPDGGVDAGSGMQDGGMTAMPDAGATADGGAAGSPAKPPHKGGKKGIVGGKLGGGGCNCRTAGDGRGDAGMLAIAIAALWLRRRKKSERPALTDRNDPRFTHAN